MTESPERERVVTTQTCRCVLYIHREDGDWGADPCQRQQLPDSPFCNNCVDRHPDAPTTMKVGVR